MKVVGICGSPRKGNSEFILKELMSKINSYNKKIVLLRDKTIQHCDGCLTCDDIGRCHVDDHMQGQYSNLLSADLLIFATPTYFSLMSGLMKTFLDRTNPIWVSFNGKKAVVIATGEQGGDSVDGAIESIKRYCKDCKIEVIAELNVKVAAAHDAEQNISVKEKVSEIAEEINKLVVGSL